MRQEAGPLFEQTKLEYPKVLGEPPCSSPVAATTSASWDVGTGRTLRAQGEKEAVPRRSLRAGTGYRLVCSGGRSLADSGPTDWHGIRTPRLSCGPYHPIAEM